MRAGSEEDGTNRRLVARCREGDQLAWTALVQQYAGLVNGILRGAFRLSAADAEDAFQEVFTRLYVKLASVRDDRALPGWISQVTRNVALDWLRRNGRELASADVAETSETGASGIDEPLRAVLDAMAVRQAMAKLPEHQREILDRFFVRDESYLTIGTALDIPPGTIASRISRALGALRKEMEGRSVPSGTSY